MSDGLSELGQAAVWYCENGFAIIPLGTNGESRKHPISKNGLNDWFDNPEDARRLWTERPNLNIGIVCGTPSHGTVVLDVDIDEAKEKDGYATLSEWERVHGELPATAVAITGSGGMHYLYRTNRTNIRPSVNRDLGIDIRADGSYIVAPPSVHPNGRRYEWQDHPDDVPIADADDNVYDLIDHVQRNGGMDDGRRERNKFKLPQTIKKGERNHVLMRYAGSLRRKGRSDEEIFDALIGANFRLCTIPLDMREVKRIAESASRYERGEDNGLLSDREIGAPGDRQAYDMVGVDQLPPFRTDKGAIKSNELAKCVMRRNHACYIDGAPATWNGTRWDFDRESFNRASLELADDCHKSHRDEVYSYLRAKMPHKVVDVDFDTRHYVQFANCTWDVVAQCDVKPNHNMFVVGTLPIELDVNAPYGFADEFLKQLADGDDDVVLALQEVIGACMCSTTVLQQSPMLIGRGKGEASNGKSTFIRMLRSLLGPCNVSSLDIATLGKRFQAEHILGKLANLGDDIPNGFLHGDELSTFKKLVTGETIYTDVKGARGFDFKPTATLIFSMNTIPRLSDASDGTMRRLAFVPFRNRFGPSIPGFDPYISNKLSLPDNLQRFAVLGLMALPDLIERSTLSPIPDMLAEVDEVKRENDVVARWVFENGIVEDDVADQWVPDVYKRFMEWCDASNERNPVNQSTFTRRITSSRHVTDKRIRSVTMRKPGTQKRLKMFKIEEDAQ